LLRRPLHVALLAAVAAVALSCHPKAADTGCHEGDQRCSDRGNLQECVDGEWKRTQWCITGCIDELGCVQCDPAQNDGIACGGGDVYECRPDGLLGALVEDCPDTAPCREGECTEPCTADGLDLIYVVDASYRLLSFDPRLLEAGSPPFEVIGNLSCPTQYSNVPGMVEGTPSPFSMSVDRDGYAWVLYTSGEIFKVDIQDASCEPTNFQRLQPGTHGAWEVFGMGYASDQPDSDNEHLFVAGGSPDVAPGGMFGVIAPDTLQIATLGTLPTDGENSPELTGNSKAELFGYFPGSSATIRQLDRTSGSQAGTEIDAGTVQGRVHAWAFAYWGDKFYIFVTDGSGDSQVMRSDRQTGEFDGVLMHSLPYVIVGAGVSTCVPSAFPD